MPHFSLVSFQQSMETQPLNMDKRVIRVGRSLHPRPLNKAKQIQAAVIFQFKELLTINLLVGVQVLANAWKDSAMPGNAGLVKEKIEKNQMMLGLFFVTHIMETTFQPQTCGAEGEALVFLFPFLQPSNDEHENLGDGAIEMRRLNTSTQRAKAQPGEPPKRTESRWECWVNHG